MTAIRTTLINELEDQVSKPRQKPIFFTTLLHYEELPLCISFIIASIEHMHKGTEVLK